MGWYKKGILVILLVIMLFPSFEFLKNIVNHGILDMKNIHDFENNLSSSLFHKEEIITNWAEINKPFMISIYPNQGFYGKNNFLFLGNHYADKIDVYRGIKDYPEDDYDVIIHNLKAYSSFFKSQDVDFLYTVSPNKTTIYPEYLPIWVTKDDQDLSPREILSKKIIDHNLSENYLDVAPFLLEAKNQYNDNNKNALFYKSDTHWTSLGANIAFNVLLNKLNYMDNSKVILNESDFSISYQQQEKDFVNLISLKDYNDLNVTFNYIFDSIEEQLLLKNDNPYWFSLFYRHNPNAIINKRIFLIRDSFSTTQLDLYSYYFSDFYYIHYSDLLNREAIISKFIPIFYSIDPDIVILQMVERTIMQTKDFDTPIDYKSIFNSQEKIEDLNNDFSISNFLYNSNNSGLVLEQTNTNASVSYEFNESENISDISFKLQLNVQNNPEILLQAESATNLLSQNFYLIPGDNSIYYQFKSDEPITKISLIIPEFLDDPIILEEFEIRK